MTTDKPHTLRDRLLAESLLASDAAKETIVSSILMSLEEMGRIREELKRAPGQDPELSRALSTLAAGVRKDLDTLGLTTSLRDRDFSKFDISGFAVGAEE